MESLEGVGVFVRQAALWAVPLLTAVILHEVAHGYVALWRGDDTALRLGRLTLNPLPHIDPVGTLLIPGFLMFVGAPWVFGYARPVPVNFARLRDPKRDMVWVALAGPATNLALAVLCAFALHRVAAGFGVSAVQAVTAVSSGYSAPLVEIAWYGMLINVVLAVFNLLPIPPLDGGRVMVGLLPAPYARLLARVEPFGFLVVIALLMTDSLRAVLGGPVRLLLGVLL
jgi:Zn-dependent protease